MALTGSHTAGDSGHVADHNLIDAHVAAAAGAFRRDSLTSAANRNTLTLGATPVANSELIWQNGTLLWPDDDYTITGAVVTFAIPTSSGDEIRDHYAHPSASSPSASALSATGQVTDSFTRANNASSLGSTEVGGGAWAAISPSTWGISSNQAYSPSNYDSGLALVNVGAANGYVEAVLTGLATTYRGVALRSDATGQNLYFADYVSDGTMRIAKTVAGSGSVISSVAGTGFTSGDRIGLRAEGTSLTAYKNRVPMFTVTDSSVTTGNYAGMRSGGTSTSNSERFDDWGFWP